jgi:V-type H+-transporting ATPase subunit d
MIVSVMQAVRDVDESSKTTAIVEEVRAAAGGSHPLGRLDPSTETALAGFGASATDIVDLVRTLLVETPVGTYFEDFLLQLLSPEDLARDDGLAETLREQPLYLFEHATKRLWMERFHSWCADQGGETAEFMCGILEERASLLALQLTDNTLADGVVRPEQRPEVLRACFPAIGPLHPTGLARLTTAASQDDIEAVVRDYEGLHALWTRCPSVPTAESAEAASAGASSTGAAAYGGDTIRSLTGTFRRHLAYRYSLLFTSQFHFGSFYAFIKLKDLEADAVEKTANAVARAERRAASAVSASGGRTRGPATANVTAFLNGLVIPFYQQSPTEAAGDGAGAMASYAQM